MNFTFLKIPVNINPSFWILLILFSSIFNSLSITSIFYAIIILISLIVHEYGHGLVALHFKATPKIILHAFGGTTYFNNKITKKQSFLITIGGPLLESFLILISYFILKTHLFHNYYVNHFFYLTYKINFFWCFLNLLPIYPLDGGRIFQYLLSSVFKRNGEKISVIISIICAFIGSCYFLLNKYFLFGSLLISYGIQNLQILKSLKKYSNKPNDFYHYNESIKAIENNELENAKKSLTKIIKSKYNNNIKFLAIESLADIYCKENQEKKAYNLLLKTDHSKLGKGKYLLCKLAYQEKNYSLIEKYSWDIYKIEPTIHTAILNSKVFAGLNNPKLSAGWFKTAALFKDEKKDLLIKILEDKIYDQVRNNKIFKDHIETIHNNEGL